MANEYNLIPLGERSVEERKAIASKGGKASAEKKKKIREWRELTQEMLSLPVTDGKMLKKFKSLTQAADSNVDGQTAIILAQYSAAMRGNTKAAEWLANLSQDVEQVEASPLVPPDLTPFIIERFDSLNNAVKRHKFTHYWQKGGRGSTKSSYISLVIPTLLITNPNTHAVVMRKVANTLKKSVYQQMIWAINELGLTDEFTFKVSPMEITLKRTGQTISFMGVDDKTKIKSFKPSFGYVGVVWYEELDQFAGMEEIRNINQSLLRGGDKYWCFYSFNPPRSRDNWVNVEQLVDDPNRLVTHANYTDVPKEWLGEQFIIEAERLKATRPELYAHEYLGEVTGTGGAVFDNVIEREITQAEIDNFDNLHHGIDFGFARDPFAYVKSHYDEKHDIIYIYDEHYEVRLKNKRAYEKIKGKVKDDIVYADSAEPKSIDELEELGLKIRGVRKGGDSRDYGMKWLSDRAKIIIDKKRCPNTYREFVTYEYMQDKDGNFISAYPKHNDHTIDAVRYAYRETMLIGKRFEW